jgi:hypothetical protein
MNAESRCILLKYPARFERSNYNALSRAGRVFFRLITSKIKKGGAIVSSGAILEQKNKLFLKCG